MPAVDAAALAKLMADLGGEPEVMQELTQTFLGEAPRTIRQMNDALARGDRRELNRTVHSLKSTAATFGAYTLSRLCRDLEGRSEASIPPDAAARCAEIAEEWERVQAELVAWRPTPA